MMLAIDLIESASIGPRSARLNLIDELRGGGGRSPRTGCSAIRLERTPPKASGSAGGSANWSPSKHEAMTRPVALVTGAGRGIGAATVAALVADGWWVAALDRCSNDPVVPYPMASTGELAAVVDAAEGAAAAFEVDVSDPSAMAGVIAAVTAEHGRLDAVVCAAGIVAGGTPLWETTDAEWDAVIATDLTGVFVTVRAATPTVLASPRGGSSPLPRPPGRSACGTWAVRSGQTRCDRSDPIAGC